MQTRGLS